MNSERKGFGVRIFFLCVLTIGCLTGRAIGSNDIGDNNRGNDNIGNNNRGSGNIGNNNAGNFNQGNNNQGSLDLGDNNNGSGQHGNGGHSAASSLVDLREKAAQGDPAAQLQLGSKYLYGSGVAQDLGTAAKWLQQATAYAGKNPSWYLRSAAFTALGIAYENNVKAKSTQEAIKWYFKSAMLNDPRGMAALSRIYSYGEGVPKDAVAALAWMYVAAGSGAPGTADNGGIKLAIPYLENKAGADGVVLARKKCGEWTSQIKNGATTGENRSR